MRKILLFKQRTQRSIACAAPSRTISHIGRSLALLLLTALSPAGAWAQTTLASAGFETSLAPFTATSSAANK